MCGLKATNDSSSRCPGVALTLAPPPTSQGAPISAQSSPLLTLTLTPCLLPNRGGCNDQTPVTPCQKPHVYSPVGDYGTFFTHILPTTHSVCLHAIAYHNSC